MVSKDQQSRIIFSSGKLSNKPATDKLHNQQSRIIFSSEKLSNKPTINKSTAVKFDSNKTDWAILPFGALEEIVKVLKFGEEKYARGNFASGSGLNYSRLINSIFRHTISFARGEDKDPESGLSHIAHVGCCVIFLLHYIVNKDKFGMMDDRAEKILE